MAELAPFCSAAARLISTAATVSPARLPSAADRQFHSIGIFANLNVTAELTGQRRCSCVGHDELEPRHAAGPAAPPRRRRHPDHFNTLSKSISRYTSSTRASAHGRQRQCLATDGSLFKHHRLDEHRRMSPGSTRGTASSIQHSGSMTKTLGNGTRLLACLSTTRLAHPSSERSSPHAGGVSSGSFSAGAPRLSILAAAITRLAMHLHCWRWHDFVQQRHGRSSRRLHSPAAFWWPGHR